VFDERDVLVASSTSGEVVGVLAFDPAMITALYVSQQARGTGVGKALLDGAKAKFGGPLELWTFVANTGAQAFYAREGFSVVGGSDGDNEEGLPDLRFRWEQGP
jgi:GNAT superfamily N-acetyltransferase